jgi:flagellar protein FliJ
MPSAQALHTLLDHARRARDEALAALQRAEAGASQADGQAQQLLQYRHDYRSRWQAQFRQHGAIELVHCYQGFTQRLAQAIDQQQQVAVQARNRVEAARALLLERELRVASVGKLLERRALVLQHAEERRDQRRSDDAAQRWRGPAGHGFGAPTTY